MINTSYKALAVIAAASLSFGGCTSETGADASTENSTDQQSAADTFYASLMALCGKAYAGKLTSNDPQDSDFAGANMVMHVAACDAEQIAIPFHVEMPSETAGTQWNRSRTWVIHHTENGLSLHHVHRHEDGKEDSVSRYGGTVAKAGQATRQEFPVDQFSIDLFNANDLAASVTNVWAVDVNDTQFAYELKREGRFFRVEFDLTKPVEAPPPPWGETIPTL
ncbi:hypothetical protein ACR9YC_02300 [Parasphingorhabdus sp. DH2-15]|uniref:hypothetical protein n=1 Tax=Parasphingorhabdus sp. DH2-15 TaxID=3444112 RepID=UPI003F682ACD